MLGHSLGAGTASLFSIMARNDEKVKPLSDSNVGPDARMGRRTVTSWTSTCTRCRQRRNQCAGLSLRVLQHCVYVHHLWLSLTLKVAFCCIQLAAKLRAETMQCVTFATPPVVTRDVAIACQAYVTTVVHQVERAAARIYGWSNPRSGDLSNASSGFSRNLVRGSGQRLERMICRESNQGTGHIAQHIGNC